jgi:hypothetical protein
MTIFWEIIYSKCFLVQALEAFHLVLLYLLTTKMTHLSFFWKTCVILCFLCNISLRNERTFKKQTIYVQCLGILHYTRTKTGHSLTAKQKTTFYIRLLLLQL